jgi:fluoroquinolone resistance protein
MESEEFEKIEMLEEESYTDCRFVSCDFSGADFRGKRFQNCQFEKCNFVTTKLDGARLQDVFFSESKLMGVDFTLCDASFLEIGFEKCLLRGCNFTDMKLKKTKFIECNLRECHFVQCNLEEANFEKSDLAGSLFHNTKLDKANFTGALQYTIDPLNNSLKGAKFSSLEALSLLKGLGVVIE